MHKITLAKAVNEAVDEELANDPTTFLLGEDVRIWGNVFGELGGLLEKYGPERVLDTPISERAIVGAAIGAALTGMRPIANIMFVDFLGVCMSEILNALSKSRYMTGGMVRMPVTILSYSGAGLAVGGEHSACLEGMLSTIKGLKIVSPSTPFDAKGLLKSAIRDDNPVIFSYHKQTMFNGTEDEIPDEEYVIPLGEADVKREGSDVTVVAIALMVYRALAAAEKLQHEKGISIEVIDPRTIVPLDKRTIINSVKKTGRLVIMDEEPITGSVASEIAAIVADEAFDHLDAPIKRVCAPDTPIPFNPDLERAWMPNEDDLIETVTGIMS
jgi:pyruvate dehydrogenase E1 component beta subunit